MGIKGEKQNRVIGAIGSSEHGVLGSECSLPRISGGLEVVQGATGSPVDQGGGFLGIIAQKSKDAWRCLGNAVIERCAEDNTSKEFDGDSTMDNGEVVGERDD